MLLISINARKEAPNSGIPSLAWGATGSSVRYRSGKSAFGIIAGSTVTEGRKNDRLEPS
jgi:hypothetical protein